MELVLNTFGTSLNRDNEAFVVSNKKGRQRVPVDGVTSIQIGRGVQVTSDAVLLAIEHEIDVLFMDRGGMPEGESGVRVTARSPQYVRDKSNFLQIERPCSG